MQMLGEFAAAVAACIARSWQRDSLRTGKTAEVASLAEVAELNDCW